nr:DUF5719 family protein [Microbacterium bovistercoris]
MTRPAWMRAARIGTTVRFTAGAVIAAATAVVVVGGVAFAWVPHTAAPASVTVAPAAADTVLTCAGPLLAIGRDSAEAGKVSVAAAESLATAGSSMTHDVLKVPGVAGDAGPTRLIAPAEGRAIPQAAGAGSASVNAEDLSGFSASGCTPALMESWLVGGGTTTGESGLLLLANPGTVAATVDLTVYGTEGPSTPGAGTNMVIAAGSQQVIALAGLGIGQESPVIRVTAHGAPVRAALQSSVTRGLNPGGVDQEGAIAAGSTTQVITGVRVTSEPQDQPTTIVRLLSPTAEGTASISVVGAHGTTGPATEVPMKAGIPVEAPLDGLAPGEYTVIVTAAQPVVGAVWQATGTGKGDDFAWVAAAPQLPAGDDGTLFAVPDGPDPQLTIVPAGADPADVVLTSAAGGGTKKFTVPGGQTSVVPVEAGAAYRLAASAPVHAAVTFAGDGAVAAFPVWPQDAASAPVKVYP